MIYEIAEIEITEGKDSEFEKAVTEASKFFKAAKGYNSLKLTRSIEHPSQYRLVIGWDTVEDHLETFRKSQGFQEWRNLAGPFFASPPKVHHVNTVFNAT
jgi:heme-degrading monooxygenase HmoA